MIKRYNQFIKENDEFRREPTFIETEEFDEHDSMGDEEFDEYDSMDDEEFNEYDPMGDEEFDEYDPMGDEEFDEPYDSMIDGEFEEEEAGDIYKNKLNELADKLGVEASNGEVNYNGQSIIFPSETEMYHVGKKKFKTADEVVDFLKRTENKTQELPELEMSESRSYKKRFRI